MLETLNFFSIQIVLLAIVTSVHTYLGLHVIRRGIVFSDLSLDQLAAFGVIVGVGFGIQGGTTASYLVSFIAVLFGSVLLAFVKPKNKCEAERMHLVVWETASQFSSVTSRPIIYVGNVLLGDMLQAVQDK